jgi:hypothetical protein
MIESIKCHNYWKNGEYNTSLVYWPYYYYYNNDPYFVSKYNARHDMIYDPKQRCVRNIRLNNGTVIEGFGSNNNFLFILVLILFFVLILFIRN